MSRIRGIEVKVQKEVLQTRKYGLNEILKKKNEDQSANTKDDGEKYQIRELLHKLPRLDKIFDVHRKIGEGTFSSVYLGSLKQHSLLPESEKRWFAIKHLVPTAHPARIEHELRCLQDMGGKDHVIGVELCLRNLDTIVFIMPYIPHKKFSEYVGEMDAEELRQYMRALLVALRHVHSFGVIHRDVKPSNFLYDRDNRRYLLVDFGLAQRLCPAPEEPAADRAPPPAHSNGVRKRTREEEEIASGAKRMALDLSTGKPVPSLTAGATSSVVPPRRVSGARGAGAAAAGSAAAAAGGAARARCSCAGAAAVCATCFSRPAPRAPRAGTQGFRPPEVSAAEVPAPDDGGGRVGERRGAGERSDGALPAVPRWRRRGGAGRARRPGGHGAAATRRRRAGPPPRGVGAAPGALPAQARRAPARRRPAPSHRWRRRRRQQHRPSRRALRALPPAAGTVSVPRRHQAGGGIHIGRVCGGVSGRGVCSGGAATRTRPARAHLRRRRARPPLPCLARRALPTRTVTSRNHGT